MLHSGPGWSAGLTCILFLAAGTAAAQIVPFSLFDVKLQQSTAQHEAFRLNTEYLLSLHVDSLLWNFRANAELPTPGDAYRSEA